MHVSNSNNMVTVSIILTVYNNEKYLARALDSILSQEVDFDLEILIGDDASTDASPSIILDYQARYPQIIVPFIRDKNLGGSKNFTDLLRNCRGKYITFIEGDDFWIDKKKLQIQRDYLEGHAEVFSVTHKVSTCNSAGKTIAMIPPNWFARNQISIEHVLKGVRFALTATMIRAVDKDELERLIRLVESGPRNAGDLSIALLILKKGPLFILDRIMSVYQYRSLAGESNYNSVTKLANRIFDRLTLIMINEKQLGFEYYFGWMYMKLLMSNMRGMVSCKLIEWPQLLHLMLRIIMALIKSSALFAWKKLASTSPVQT